MMTHLIDITDMTDNVLDIVLEARANPDAAIVVEHLTRTELSQLAQAMGWEPTARLANWMASTDVPAENNADAADYEGAILARDEHLYL